MEEIQKALIELGFTRAGKYYKKDGLNIIVYDSTTLTEIFKKLIQWGRTQKTWEVKRVLETD